MNGHPIYIGIDPGVSGGMAAVDSVGRVMSFTKMPETEREVLHFLSCQIEDSLLEDGRHQVRAVLERVSSSPQMGVASAFTFGRGYGVLRTALIASGIPFDEVSPRRWQPAVGIAYPKNSTDVVKKNITKRRAQDLFPMVKVTHALADSLLIAEFCRRSALGQQATPAASSYELRP